MIKLLLRSMKYSLSAHFSNPANLLAGALGMFMNNIIFLIGMWGMLFAGKSGTSDLGLYYIALNALIMTAWGAINFFCGGFYGFGELVVSGQFESKLSTPRHPLLLVATHELLPSALGDLVMGTVGIGILFVLGHPGMAFRTAIASLFGIVGLFSVYVFAGSLAFFAAQGNRLSRLIIEMVVSLSSYPMGKVFPSGFGRIVILLTPAAAVSILPLDWIETSGWSDFLWALLALGGALALALFAYSMGVKRFQAMSLIGAQS